jgi:glycosyltransferase involved in cell wall biosynthesis
VTRIGIDYTAAVRQSAGIGRYTRELVGAVAELDRDNEYILFSAGRDPQQRRWPDNFSLRALPLTDRHLAILWQRLRVPIPVEWITGRVDLFHSPDFVLPPVRRARTAVTVHDLSFMRHPECSSPPLLDYLMRSVPPSVRRADVVLADSAATRDDLIELLGIPPDRITVVYAAIDHDFGASVDETPPEPTLARYGIRRPYILGLGTLQPRKNFVRLIHAYHQLRERHDIPHQLVIGGGRGWLDQEIDEAIEGLGLENAVRLAGFIAEKDLPALYHGADVFAFPSLYEGFGIPVLEAMACGTPVVTSTTSSLPEVAGDAALLVEPTNVEALSHALDRLIHEESLRDSLIERGYRQITRFSWHDSARRLLEVYNQITH